MKTLKNYKNFSESYRLNENLLRKAWDSIVNFFKIKYNKKSWLYYAIFLKKSGQLPKEKVEIIIPPNLSHIEDEVDVDEVRNEVEEDMQIQSESIDWSNVTTSSYINEEVINLSSDKIENVDIEQMKEKIYRIFKLNKQRVKEGKSRTKANAVFIWGAPGIGKTEILNQVAKELGVVVQEWHLSQIEPTDFRGIPKIENVKGTTDPKHERTVTKLPELFPDTDDEGGGIMFFDELNRAPKMVLSAALSLCGSGKVGTYELPKNWIVIAAGNRIEDLGGAAATVIEPALANRFSHVNYVPEVDQWIKWAALRPNINPDVLNFIKFGEGYYFHRLDPDLEPTAYPTPRSWEMASDEEYAERDFNWENNISINKIQHIYAGYVGIEAATKFAAYLELKKYFDEKDINNVYKNPEKAREIPIDRPDKSYAALTSIASYKKGKKFTVTELNNLLKYLDLRLAGDFEKKTQLFSVLKDFHPEVKEDKELSKIYLPKLKEWHIDMQKMTGGGKSKK